MRYYFRENARRYEIMTRMGLEDWATQMYGGIDFHDFSWGGARCGSEGAGEGQAPALRDPGDPPEPARQRRRRMRAAVEHMCRVLKISSNGYYARRRRWSTTRRQSHGRLATVRETR